MADSQPERSREQRFSKALVARIAAVGLFVALGTVAVVFMMSRGGSPVLISEGDQEKKETETASEEQPGFTAQVQASFADSANPAVKTNLASFNPTTAPSDQNKTTPISLPSFNPSVESAKTQPPKDSFKDDKTAQPSGPPERFAALDGGIGRPPVRTDDATESNRGPGRNDFASEQPLQPPQPRDNLNGRLPGDNLGLGSKQDKDGSNSVPNPAAKQDNGPNEFGSSLLPSSNKNTQPLTERPGSEPLKPFTPPELPNRLVASPDAGAPNLKAPTPNPKTDFNSFENEPPKVANNALDNSPGNPGNSGILKPFEPPLKDDVKPLSQRPQNDFEQGAPPNPANSRLTDRPENSFGGYATQNGGSRETPNDRPLTTSILNPQSAPNRPVGQPVSAPISIGSPINQPTGNPMRSDNPSGFGEVGKMSEPRTANVPGERRLEGVQAPALAIEKLSPKEMSVNEVADFIIVIRNLGRVDANDVIVHDQVPANTEFQSSNPPPQQTSADRKLNWDLGTIKAGQEKRIQYQLKPTTAGEIGSVAHVSFSTQASMRTTVTQPVLEIVHRAKPVAMIGSDVIFDVVVTNKGDGPAKNVLIQEDVPPQLQYQEGFRELEYEIGNLMPGQSKRVQLGLKAVDVGRLKNIVIATAAGGQRAQHELDMEVVAPKLTLNSDGPTKRYLGRQVAHAFKITNPGTASATNVDLVAKLPAGLRFVRADNQGVYRQANHAVYWSMAELTANAEATVELTTMPVEVGSQDIRFDIVADLNQKASIVQPLSIEHMVDIFFDIDDLVDPIEVGAETAYQVKIANQGTQTSSNIQLQLDFPNGILPTSVEGTLQHQINGQRVQFAPINDIKPGEQFAVIVRAKGQIAGDHRVVVTLQADGRQSAVAKEEITRVYSDR